MATYTFVKKDGFLLTPAPVSYYTIPAATKSMLNVIDVENLGMMQARVWAWLAPSGWTPNVNKLGIDLRNDAVALRRNGLGPGAVGGSGATLPGAAASLASGYILGAGQGVNFGATPAQMLTAEQLWMMTDYADYGTENVAVITTAEIVVAAAVAVTFTAITLTDTGAAYTVSPANGDLVGRRIESNNAYCIVTANTATVITCTDGWRNKSDGRQFVSAGGNLFPTTGIGNDGYTVMASMRDTRKTALTQDAYVGHLLTTGDVTARRQAVCVGNSAGVATYGTTFQITRDYNGTAGGWPTGTPTTGKDWLINSLVRLMINAVEES